MRKLLASVVVLTALFAFVAFRIATNAWESPRLLTLDDHHDSVVATVEGCFSSSDECVVGMTITTSEAELAAALQAWRFSDDAVQDRGGTFVFFWHSDGGTCPTRIVDVQLEEDVLQISAETDTAWFQDSCTLVGGARSFVISLGKDASVASVRVNDYVLHPVDSE